MCCSRGRVSPGTGAKVCYLLIMFILIVLGIVIRAWGPEIYKDLYSFDSGCETTNAEDQDRCLSLFGAYRVSAGTFLFFIFTAVLCRCWRGFHTGLWCIKVPLLIFMVAVQFFIPNAVYGVYSEISRIGSILFILLQILILIDFAFDVHEFTLGKAAEYDAELAAEGYEANVCGNKWRVLYVLMSLACLIAALAGIFVMFAIMPLCSLNIAFLSSTLLLGVVYTVMSVLQSIGRGLLPPAIVFAYCTFLCWGAIRSNPDVDCNPSANDSDTTSVLVGMVIAALSLTWTSFRTADAGYDVLRCSAPQEDSSELAEREARRQHEALENALTTDASDKPADEGDAAGSGDDGSPKPARKKSGANDDEANTEDDTRFWFFHIVMALGGLYMGMLLTNWGSTDGAALTANTELSEQSMWVKIISQWVSVLLYVWILVAPLCFPNREFSDPHNAFA